MRKFTAIATLVALTLSSCASASQFTVSGTMPDQGNCLKCGATCTAPILEPLVGSVRAHVAWTGGSAGEDSTAASAPGAAWSLTKVVPPGTYTIRAWFTNSAGAGCDTTFTHVVTSPVPHKKPVVVN